MPFAVPARCAGVLALALIVALPAPSRAAEPGEVKVVNLPKVQEVTGTVTLRDGARVTGRIDATRFIAYENRDVAPLVGSVSPRDYQLIGTIEADGYASVVLSIAGWVTAGAADGGKLGVLLLPDLPFAREALDREGAAPLSLRAEVSISRAAAGRTVAASSERLVLPFPRWRVYLYNTSSSTVRAHAFAMLGD